MDVALRPFTAADIEVSEAWQSAVHLDSFMSRSAPDQFNGTVDQDSPDYRWFVIVVDGEDAGAIWLEREAGEPSVARLGIFLAEESRCGRGVGRAAIARAIGECQRVLGFDRVRLHVRVNNPRAIACYERCGFQQVGRGTRTVKHAAIDFLIMEKKA
jgi:RimJ/RimL family protein N-acetyltransferase